MTSPIVERLRELPGREFTGLYHEAADLIETKNATIERLTAENAELRANLERARHLHRKNLSTMWEARTRFQSYGKSHAELDVAIEETSRFLEGGSDAERS